MSYTSNTPQGSQQISQTQSLIQANFMALSSFGNGYAEMSLQVTAPAFGATSNGFYCLSYPTTLTNELYIHRQAAATGLAEVPFSASKMSNNIPADCDDGWTYLPSGLLMKWGVSAAASSIVSITPTTTSGGPNFSRVFKVYVTAFDSSGSTNFTCGQKTVANNTSGNFDAYCANPTATTAIEYLVIGV